MQLPNLGIVVPIATATGIGLLRRTAALATEGSAGADPSSLAQLVILAVIPQATTEPTQTGLNRIAVCPDLARPNGTVKNRKLAVIS
jgi:hypothetical protein